MNFIEGKMGRLYKDRWAYIFLLPAFIPFLLFIAWPLANGLRLSLYDVKLTSKQFIGLTNYAQMLKDTIFHRAIVNTLWLTLGLVPASTVISLGLSLLAFGGSKRLHSFVRVSFYMPIVCGTAMLSLVWRWFYDPMAGLFNYLLGLVGIPRLFWLSSYDQALFACGLFLLSMMLGRPIVLFLAGLGAIPEELHDAASVDGANTWQRLWRVTLPLLVPTTLFVVVTQTIGTWQAFVVVLLLTGGGPAYATQTIVFRIYQMAFENWDLGYASTMSMVLLAIVGVIAFLQFRLLGREVEY